MEGGRGGEGKEMRMNQLGIDSAGTGHSHSRSFAYSTTTFLDTPFAKREEPF